MLLFTIALAGQLVLPPPSFVAPGAFVTTPPSVATGTFWQAPDDPADSLLRVASNRMARGDYREAADIYRAIVRRYPSSMRLSEAMYYEAFALYRAGDFSEARDALDALRRRFPQAAARGDANTLRTRICGALAREGDSECAEEVTRLSSRASTPSGPSRTSTPSGPNRPSTPSGPSAASAPGGRSASSCPDGDDDDDDTRVAALNALLQMDADRAMPILTTVLARRDRCSERLRRKAVFLVAQKQTTESANVLLSAAKNDPDSEVRQQAVFWLSQVRDPRAVDMLVDIVSGEGEQSLREKAIFALSQHSNPAAGAALRAFAENEREDTDLRERAIFSLGQRRGTEQGEYLRGLYRKVSNENLREKILFALSQQRNAGNEAFVRAIALDARESIELRKKAIFNLSQMGSAGSAPLIALYGTVNERELREQLIFALSQRRDVPSVDKLMDIARSDPDRALRSKAVFWLGQSRDPRVTAFLTELINK
jgi:HEAT repeat protein